MWYQIRLQIIFIVSLYQKTSSRRFHLKNVYKVRFSISISQFENFELAASYQHFDRKESKYLVTTALEAAGTIETGMAWKTPWDPPW